MKKYIIYPILIIYQLFIALPLLVLATFITALLTILFAFIADKTTLVYLPAKYWSRLACYLFFIKVKVTNIDIVNKNESVIFVANHQSMFDVWAIYGWLPTRFSWIMKKELGQIPLVGLACKKVGHIFMDRTNAAAAKRSLAAAQAQLTNGNCVVVFPEGTRSKTGKLGIFKKGAFTIAQELNLPIVPIAIKGAYECFNPNNRWVRPGTIELVFHERIKVIETDDMLNYLKTSSREILLNSLNN